MTSFSLAVEDPDSRRRLRRKLQKRVRWLPSGTLSAKTPETFRDAYGCAINAAMPPVDLLVIDEAHNLKHGFGLSVSNRNRVMGFAFGHPEGKANGYSWYRHKAKRVLLLSATPFEDDYAAIQRQLDVLGYGKARLWDSNGSDPVSVDRLLSADVSEDEKRKILGRLMVRRVAGLRINGRLYTKNMYRREWRQGGYRVHDEPMRIADPKQRLVVGLMQKKVAEILRDERFKNSFQIGMLSSFESFLETIGRSNRPAGLQEATVTDDEDGPSSIFDGKQGDTDDECRGIDTKAIAAMVESYRTKFGGTLPHPKLDSTADSFAPVFETGDKVLVFVRRVRTVDELAAKLNAHFDRWLCDRMTAVLPGLAPKIHEIFERYARERARRPDEQQQKKPLDEAESEPSKIPEERGAIDEDDDGSAETFFSWFFRGSGPRGVLSGAAFQKNRLSKSEFRLRHVLRRRLRELAARSPSDPLAELADIVGVSLPALVDSLRPRAYRHFTHLTQQEKGYPRLHVFLAYQQAALELIEKAGGQLGDQARIMLDERFRTRAGGLQIRLRASPVPNRRSGSPASLPNWSNTRISEDRSGLRMLETSGIDSVGGSSDGSSSALWRVLARATSIFIC